MKIAATIGSRLKGGEVIQLVSDVGGGKTTFVRGLAKGAGSEDKVASPSFTIAREYRAPTLTIHHFDFYRLADAGLVANELAEVLEDDTAVIIIEWADIIEAILPASHMIIRITSIGDNERELAFSCPTAMAYLRDT